MSHAVKTLLLRVKGDRKKTECAYKQRSNSVFVGRTTWHTVPVRRVKNLSWISQSQNGETILTHHRIRVLATAKLNDGEI